MIAVESSAYHAHVYFSPDRQATAAALQARAREALGGRAWVQPLKDRPVGPHTAPMFEIDFSRAHRDDVVAWLERHRGELSVLVHPLTENEFADHTVHVAWLGDEQPLDLAKL